MPAKFDVDNAVPGVTFDLPTCIAFLPDGRLLVGEKRGRIWVVKNGIRASSPLWSRENEVETNGDCGLMSIGVDPNFASNGYLYFLYTVDPDSNGVDTDLTAFGRLTRYQMDPTLTALIPGSRAVLLGVDWTHGPVTGGQSHTVGSLRWGSDGSLLVSVGDGSVSSQMDPGGLYADAFGPGRTDLFENIGAFRAQYPGSLCGKLLRIDPATGHGYPSNPYYDGDPTSVVSRIWSLGFRNPFRITVRPGTGSADPSAGDPGTLYVGDVGWLTWEEIDIATQAGTNFGWPCIEGPFPQPAYQTASPLHHGCGTIDAGTLHPPNLTWNHTDSTTSTPAGLLGNCAMSGVFYTGTRYPLPYQGRYFFCDFGRGWIKTATVDANDQIVSVAPFADGLDGPVDFATHPSTGDLYYVAIETGEVRRIRYLGPEGNAPVPSASGTPTLGTAPLTVSFSSDGSYSPIGRPITFFWNFGDGTGTSDPDPQHIYATPRVYEAILTASDDQGAEVSDTVRVVVTNGSGFPTTSVLDDFNRADGPLGGAWVGGGSTPLIQSQQLTQTVGVATPIWDGGLFGPEQEAYVTLNQITATSPTHGLMLAVQGTSIDAGHIQVRYDATVPRVLVSTFAPDQQWVGRGEVNPASFAPGDRLGARLHSNGLLEVFRNDSLLATLSVGNWPFVGQGGRIGLALVDAMNSKLDDFGGGDSHIGLPIAPTATILSPQDSTFFVAGVPVVLSGLGTDADDSDASLTYHWEVDVHHNNHIHPGTFVSDHQLDFMTPDNHDDGTGVYFEVRFQVSDPDGLTGEQHVDIFPEIDLTPGELSTIPTTPGTDSAATYGFWIHNRGRMPAPYSHWVLQSDGIPMASGDTLVGALDSVRVTRIVGPMLPAGIHTLRAVADTLGGVVETDESNNGAARQLTVVQGTGPDIVAPVFLEGPDPDPYGVHAWLRWRTNEPAAALARYGPTPQLADSVRIAVRDTTHAVDLTGLAPDTRYYYAVWATDSAGNTRSSPVDSFTTQEGPLATPPDLPLQFAVSEARPNPSHGEVRFAVELPERSHVRAAMYDVQGRAVWREPERDMEAGRWTLRMSAADARALRDGLYFTRIELGRRTYVRRIAFVR